MGKSLLSQTSKPKKKIDKYSEISSIKSDYKFSLKDTVIYLGLVVEYKGLTCIITKKNKRKTTEYYRIKFVDGEELNGVAGGFLKTLEEYELCVLDQDKEDTQGDMSEIELEIISKGLEPMRNKKSCHNQLLYYQRSCEQCNHEPVCIYWKKYKYDKVKFE